MAGGGGGRHWGAGNCSRQGSCVVKLCPVERGVQKVCGQSRSEAGPGWAGVAAGTGGAGPRPLGEFIPRA